MNSGKNWAPRPYHLLRSQGHPGCGLGAVLEDRRSPFVPIPIVQENSVSCEVERCAAEVFVEISVSTWMKWR